MIIYKSPLKLYSGSANRAFFGAGPAQLLQAIDQTHSIAKAAKQMKMAYTKALAMLKRAEDALGTPLVHTQTGGKGGGGSMLTPTAKAWLKAYTLCQTELNKKADSLYKAHIRPLI